jgi:hypothetical protein
MSEKLGHFAIAALLSIFSASFVLAADENNGIREISDSVYSFTPLATITGIMPAVGRYSHWVGYEEWLEMNTLRLMTDLWMGPFPWITDAR